MRLRNNINNLSPDGDEAKDLVRAFRDLKLIRPFNYDYWASLHRKCPHASALFLPWHRAYIYEFETALRQASNNTNLTLPYWDWVTDPQLPPIVTDPTSALYVPGRYTDDERKAKHLYLPTKDQIAEVQTKPTFIDYGGRGCVDAGQVGGALENRHNLVHFWVSERMTEPASAAEDPVFWFHHANVDRLWAEWQRTHVTDLPCECLDHDLPAIPGCYKGKEAVDINGCRFGYAYVDRRSVIEKPSILDPFPARPLVVSMPPLERRVYLVLENVTVTGGRKETVPTGLKVFQDGNPDRQVTQSLFGLMRMQMDEQMHHQHMEGMHQFNLRIDVTSLLTYPSQNPTRELVVSMTSPTDRTSRIRIERILVEVSGY